MVYVLSVTEPSMVQEPPSAMYQASTAVPFLTIENQSPAATVWLYVAIVVALPESVRPIRKESEDG